MCMWQFLNDGSEARDVGKLVQHLDEMAQCDLVINPGKIKIYHVIYSHRNDDGDKKSDDEVLTNNTDGGGNGGGNSHTKMTLIILIMIRIMMRIIVLIGTTAAAKNISKLY